MPITIGGKNPTKFEAPSGPVFRRKPTVPGVVSGLAEMALGAGFLVTWFKPDLLGQEWVLLALELMLLKFILVHSAAFMGMKGTGTSPAMTRLKWFGGIGAFYSLFVLGFCLSLDSWRPMASFWIITMQRLMGDVYEPKPSAESKVWFTTSIAMNAMLYLLLVMGRVVGGRAAAGGCDRGVLLSAARMGYRRGVAAHGLASGEGAAYERRLTGHSPSARSLRSSMVIWPWPRACICFRHPPKYAERSLTRPAAILFLGH
jgi:hypothetical protein